MKMDACGDVHFKRNGSHVPRCIRTKVRLSLVFFLLLAIDALGLVSLRQQINLLFRKASRVLDKHFFGFALELGKKLYWMVSTAHSTCWVNPLPDEASSEVGKIFNMTVILSICTDHAYCWLWVLQTSYFHLTVCLGCNFKLFPHNFCPELWGSAYPKIQESERHVVFAKNCSFLFVKTAK